MTLQTYVLYTTYITGYNTQCSVDGKGLQLYNLYNSAVC